MLTWVIQSFFSLFSGLNFNCMAIDAIECFTCFHPAWRAELRRGLLEFRQLVLRQHAWKAAQSQGHGARWCEHVRVESSLRPLHKWLRMLRMAAWHSQLTDTDWMVDVCWGGSSPGVRHHFFCKIFPCSSCMGFHSSISPSPSPRVQSILQTFLPCLSISSIIFYHLPSIFSPLTSTSSTIHHGGCA